MARRSSTASVSLLPPPLSSKPSQSAREQPAGDTKPKLDGRTPPKQGRAASSSTYDALVKQNGSATKLDPDELFFKHTVSEVKTIQQRLRTDADNKQEELRLMVGERYRDLLQASTSIMAIAQSSQKVLDALQDMKATVHSVSPQQAPKRTTSDAQDKHLQTLQSLAAHMKILLDAPEHLWRLIEKKMYFNAAWLFLLARVVQQSLLRENTDEDSQWRAYNIDVAEQFPLIHRQWEAISQFRSQIAHRATLSLRELTSSSGHVCATLLSLHLLESRPLQETLVVFLTQRSKALSTGLLSTRGANGHAAPVASGQKAFQSRKVIVRESKQKIEAVLDVVSRTLGTARIMFREDDSTGKRSMMSETLQSMQTNSPSSALPSELQLTTSVLLTSLPSSPHPPLLPTTISSYTPYVDGASSVPQADLHQRLQQWFHKAIEDCRVAMTRWISDLESVREVWDVRTFISDLVNKADGLDSEEKWHVKSVIDDICQQQIRVAWQSAVEEAHRIIRERLATAIFTLRTANDVSDIRPIEFLLQAPPLPASSLASATSQSTGVAYRKYKTALQKQLLGQTPLFDDVLGISLQHAQILQDAYNVMRGDDEQTRALVEQLSSDCRPDIDQFAARILDTLEDTVDNIEADSDLSIRILVFVGRIAEGLCSSPDAVSTFNCIPGISHAFKGRSEKLHSQIVDRWQSYLVHNILEVNWPRQRLLGPKIKRSAAGGSSSNMSHALLALSTSCLELRLMLDSHGDRHLVKSTLQRFAESLLDHFDGEKEKQTWESRLQAYSDLTILCRMLHLWTIKPGDNNQRIGHYLSEERRKMLEQGYTEGQLCSDATASEFLSRTQTLFPVLFPDFVPPRQTLSSDGKMDKSLNLLRFGVPSTEQQPQSAILLAKPPPRFGLLLVGSTSVR